MLSQASSYANVSAASADGDRRRNFQLSSVLTDLKNGSSALYDKAVSIVTDVRGTVAALSPPARNFLDEVRGDRRREARTQAVAAFRRSRKCSVRSASRFRSPN